MGESHTSRLDLYDAIALILQANEGALRGRTALHKLTYLSSVMINEIKDPAFKPHYYGPYSAKLSLSLAKMVSYSFLEETSVPGNVYGGYLYKMTEDGKEIAKDLVKNHTAAFKKIQRIVDVCKEFCNLESAPLACASKIHYILDNMPQGGMTEKEATRCARKLGWDVNEDDVRQGVELLKRLDLVHTK